MENNADSTDQLECPILPEEERYLVGAKTKSFRKKCSGRLKKQSADYAMLV